MNITELEKVPQVKALVEALELEQDILDALQIYLLGQGLYTTAIDVRRIKNIGIKALAPFQKSTRDK